MSKKVAFHTLGCKLNFAESSSLLRDFVENGWQMTQKGEEADLVFINTCTVTQSADAKSRKAVRQAAKKFPNAFVVVTGCSVQTNTQAFSTMEEVDMVLGMGEKFNFFKYFDEKNNENIPAIHSCNIDRVQHFDSAWSGQDRTRTFLKIQDGCDYACSYCIIPKARGKSRNKPIAEILKDTEKIAKNGKKEIILTGVNIGDFGKSTGESFYDLLNALDKQAAVPGIRISSVEPNLLKSRIIDLVSNSKIFKPHFHIPLQSGSSAILKKMKRAYNTTLFAKRIEYIKKCMPHAFIGIDIIVGFPGETENNFKESYNLLKELEPAFLHVFSYSDRQGTPASVNKEKVASEVIKKRSDTMHELSNSLHTAFYKKFADTEQNVLFEYANKKGKIGGFTDNYLRVETNYKKGLANTIQKVRLLEINENLHYTCEPVKNNTKLKT